MESENWGSQGSGRVWKGREHGQAHWVGVVWPGGWAARRGVAETAGSGPCGGNGGCPQFLDFFFSSFRAGLPFEPPPNSSWTGS